MLETIKKIFAAPAALTSEIPAPETERPAAPETALKDLPKPACRVCGETFDEQDHCRCSRA